MAKEHHLIPRLDGYQLDLSTDFRLDGYVSSGSVTSEPIPVAQWSSYHLTVTCPSTGSPNGTLKLQMCNDEERDRNKSDSTLTNWTDISGATSALVGASQIDMSHHVKNGMTYRWMRMVYTPSSGSITLTCRVQLKDNQ